MIYVLTEGKLADMEQSRKSRFSDLLLVLNNRVEEDKKRKFKEALDNLK